MNRVLTLVATSSSLALLSACDGGSSDGEPTVPPAATPSYETLDSRAATTSTLGGVALQRNRTNFRNDIVNLSGSTTHSTGNTTLSDGLYTLRDPDGFNGSNQLTDGSATLTEFPLTSDRTENYEYVTYSVMEYNSGGDEYATAGVGGVVTNSSDVPTTGTATYTGGARGSVSVQAFPGSTSVNNYALRNGSSIVEADFGAGTVDVEMTGFTAFDTDTSAQTIAPIDTISVTGMTIAGNGFSGGTFETENGGSPVDIMGSNATTTNQGNFFGYDASASAPDEVGGVAYGIGDTGAVIGIFIAD